MKKVLSFVLVLTLVLGSFSMAFAATPTDVAGTDWEEAVGALTELGVVNGYTDGTYQPTKSVNRAEAAKLVISALGLTDYAAGNTASFTDLDGYQWATGYIGYAEALGILKGVGEGKFNPGGEVTYEQLATMLVRALGWTDAALPGTWPANYVVRAKALGIMNDITAVGSVAANRGDVAVMIYNTLECPIGYVNLDNQWIAYGAVVNGVANGTADSMLVRLSKDVFKYDDGTVVSVMLTENGGYFVNGNTIDLISYAKGVNLGKDYGSLVNVFRDTKGKITGVKAYESTLLTGKFTTTDTALKFTADGTTYTVDKTVATSDVYQFVNNRLDATPTVAAFAIGDALDGTMTLAVDVSGKTIKDIYSKSTWNGTNEIYTASDATKLTKSDVLCGKNFEMNDSNEIDTSKFVLVGVESLDKIPEGAAVTIYTDTVDPKYVTKVEVSTATIEGKVTKVNSDGDFVINGTAYATDACADANPGDVRLSSEGKFFLNYAGDIVKFDGTTKLDNYAIVNTVAKAYTTGGYDATTKYAVELVTADGKTATYEIKKSTTITGAGMTPANRGKCVTNEAILTDVAENSIIAYHLNADGLIDDIEVPLQNPATGNQYTAKGFLAGIKVADNAVVFTGAGSSTTDDLAVGTLKDIPVAENLSANTKYIKNDDGDKIVAIWCNDAATDSTFGVMVSYADVENADEDTVYELVMLIDGVEKTYLTENQTGTYDCVANQVVLVKISFSGDEITGAVTTNDAFTLGDTAVPSVTAEAIKDGSIKLEGGAFVEIADDVVIYEITRKANGSFDKWVVHTDLSVIAAGDQVKLYNTDTTKGHDGYDVIIFEEM